MLVSLSRSQQDFLRKYIRTQLRKFIITVPIFSGIGFFIIYLGLSDHDVFNIIAAAFGVVFLLVNIFIIYSSIRHFSQLNYDLRAGNIEAIEGVIQKKESYQKSSLRVTIENKKYLFLDEAFEKVTTGERFICYHLPTARLVIDAKKSDMDLPEKLLPAVEEGIVSLTEEEIGYFKRDLTAPANYFVAGFLSLMAFLPITFITLPFRDLITDYFDVSFNAVLVTGGFIASAFAFTLLIRRFRRINNRIIQEGKKRIQTLPIDELKNQSKRRYQLGIKSNGKQFSYSIDETLYRRLANETYVTIHTSLCMDNLFYLYTESGELLYDKFKK